MESKPIFATDNQSITLSGQVYCSIESLIGQTIRIHNIQNNIAPVLVRFKLADGSVVSGLINSSNPEWVIPAKLTADNPAYKFLKLGVKHLLSGYDHVLFVIAMVLLVSGASALIKAISCFTLGHSISLALSSFNIVSFSTGIVEILIAASIISMALEIYNKKTRFAQHVWIIATVFGLLHGLGFAAVLSEFSLPDKERVAALLAFNVGLELGQLLIIAICLSLGKIIMLFKAEAKPFVLNGPRYIAYLFGSISAFWVLERTQLLLFG
jgi:hydrogenase/urease accessory protein HupE